MESSSFLDIALSLVTLTILEAVLGIDNLVFLSILSQRLPRNQQKVARKIGLTLSWVARLILLASAVWLTTLTTPFLTLFSFSFSGNDIFMITGGLFLLAKSTQEIHYTFETKPKAKEFKKYGAFAMVITQIILIDIVFSLDSVLTAIGLTTHFWLMASAITIAIIIMLFCSEHLNQFIDEHPTIRILALSFLLLIGTMLLADGFGFHLPRSYIYFAIGFSIFVEILNTLF